MYNVHVWLRLCLVVSLCALSLGCQSGTKSKAANKTPAIGTQASALDSLSAIKPLDAPGNPYAGKYQEWDHWIARNAVAVGAPGVNLNAVYDFNPEEDPEHTGHSVRLDENGYLLPLVEDCRLLEESKAVPPESRPRFRTVASFGKIDPELYAQSVDAYEEARAAYYAPIPAWLAENPPIMTVMLPNGEIVTKGMPGSGLSTVTPESSADGSQLPGKSSSSTGCCGGSAENPGWFRYSADGEMLGSTPREFWWYLYYDPEINPLPEGKMTFRNDAYAIFTDPSTGRILHVLDWDGSPLPAVEPAWRTTQPFSHLTARRLQSYYAAQQRILNGTAAPGIVLNPVGLEQGAAI
jgi:hypothetical protein